MILLGIEALTLNQDEQRCLTHPIVAGVVLFSRNYQSIEQLIQLIQMIKAINPSALVAIDQEGGRVQRIKAPLTRLPAMQVFGQLYDQTPTLAVERIYQLGQLVGMELASLGININFSPVLDIDLGLSQVIGDRALHHEPDVVALLAQHYIKGISTTGVLPVAKHFPGHGAVQLDSHVASPIDQREFSDIWTQDIAPYRQLLAQNQLPAIMMAHVIYPNISSGPAGFCPIWLGDIVREKLGFTGWVFTDDLAMQAAHHAGTMVERVQTALCHGANYALVCNYEHSKWELLQDVATKQAQFLPFKQAVLHLSYSSLPEVQKMKHYQYLQQIIQAL